MECFLVIHQNLKNELIKVIIPNSIEIIGEWAFAEHYKLKNIDTVINLTNVEDLVINMYMFAEMQNNNYVLTQEGFYFHYRE